MSNLKNKKVAILAADGYEQTELESPMKALKDAGAEIEIICLKSGEINSHERSSVEQFSQCRQNCF